MSEKNAQKNAVQDSPAIAFWVNLYCSGLCQKPIFSFFLHENNGKYMKTMENSAVCYEKIGSRNSSDTAPPYI